MTDYDKYCDCSNLEQIFGRDKIVNELYNLLNPLFSENGENLDLKLIPSSIGFYGNIGMGTTFIIKHIANKLKASLKIINGVDIHLNYVNILTELYNTNNKKTLIVITDYEKIGGYSYQTESKAKLERLMEMRKSTIVTFIVTSAICTTVDLSYEIKQLKSNDLLNMMRVQLSKEKINKNVDLSYVIGLISDYTPKQMIKFCNKLKINKSLKNKKEICVNDFETILGKSCKKPHNDNKKTTYD